MTGKRMPERCGNCRYHIFDIFDELEDSCVCVNKESEEYLAYTEHDQYCPKWEKKTCLTLEL